MGLGSRVRAALARALLPAQVLDEKSNVVKFLQAPTSPAPDADALVEASQISAIIGRCVNVISRDCADVPLQLFDYSTPDRPKEIFDHPAILLWRHINPVDSPVVFLEQAFADLVGEGNFYAYLDFGGGAYPTAMLRLPPEEIDVVSHPTRIISGYKWTHHDVEKTYSDQVVMHVRTRNPAPDYRGLGLYALARDQIRFERYLRAWKEHQIRNGVPTSMIISVRKAFANEKEWERYREEFYEKHRGLENQGKPTFVRGEDVTVTPIDRPKEDEVAWLGSLNHVRNEIAMLFGVPPSRLSDYSESFRATAPEQTRTYWQDTIMGWHRLFLDYLNSTFIPKWFPDDVDQSTLRPRIGFAFDYSKIPALALAMRDMATVQEIMIRNAMRTPARAAVAMGDPKPEDPEADKLYMNGKPLGEDPMEELLKNLPPPGSQPSGGEQRPEGETEPEPEDEADANDGEEGRRAAVLWGSGDERPRPSLRMVPGDLIDESGEAERLRKRVERIIAEMIRIAGAEEIESSGILGSFDMKDPAVLEAIRTQSILVSGFISRGIRDAIREAVAVAISEGYDHDRIRRSIRAVFRDARADWKLDRIAKTESHQAHEAGGHQALRQNGVEKKRWVTGARPRSESRADHLNMDGQVQPIDAPFVDPASGARLMYPGDVSGAVSATDVVNCNCIKVADFSDLLGERRLRGPVDPDEVWARKAKTRRRFEGALKIELRRYLVELEKRALEELERQDQGGARAPGEAVG